jgi:AmmeMemoRadiSam system protein B/AmmeMemoRadiSam system protein A
MREQNRQLRQIMPIMGYLAALVFFALGATLLLTLGKGWDRQQMEAAIEQFRQETEAYSPREMADNTRPAAAAGQFYPFSGEALAAEIEKLLSAAPPIGLKRVQAILVPHAGYIYSGSIAAAAFREVGSDFQRVFILAANHSSEADFSNVSLPPYSHYQVPGARIPLANVVDDLMKDQLFQEVPAAHTKYVIEVELPFLHGLKRKAARPDFTIIPMILGKMNKEAIAGLAEILSSYADERTLFVFSVDLSHFYPDRKARQLDSSTIQAILSRDDDVLSRTTADGPQVLRTMVRLAELQGWESTLLKYDNSGTVSGDPSSVVGYSAIAFHEPFSLSAVEKQKLLQLARRTIEEYLDKGDYNSTGPDLLEKHAILNIPRSVFVTLKKSGELRGCIGDIVSPNPLHENIQFCAVRSAVNDYRFEPVSHEELNTLVISISVLEFPTQLQVDNPLQYPSMLRPGKDGVILSYNGKRSTYLPQVWEEIPNPVSFLSQLCLKQGSPSTCWQERQAKLYRYGALEFGESHE